MAAAFVRVTMAECTPAADDSYEDVDANSYGVPAGAVGVWVRALATTSYAYSWDVRKNGSTDAWGLGTLQGDNQTMAYVGIDANGVLEAQTSYSGRMDIHIMGYMTSPVTMNTNATDVSTGTTGSYVDTDVSVACPGATMVLMSAENGSSGYDEYTRANGSTDDRYSTSEVYGVTTRGVLSGVDGSQVFEQKLENASGDLFVQGYYAGASVTMHTNATDRSTTTTGSYVDVTALPAGALVGFYDVVQTYTTAYSVAVRKNGSSETPYAEMRDTTRCGWIVECDANRIVEQRISNARVDLWELGYAIDENSAPSAPTSLLCEGAASPQSVTDTTPEFSAVYDDPNTSDVATHFEVEVNTTEAFDGTSMWDSGWIDIADCNENARCADVSYAGTTLAETGTTYYWRCRFKDTAAAEGAWSAVSSFRMKPKAVSVTDTGSGADGTPGIGPEVPVTDTGAGSEIAGLSFSMSVSETGAGADGAPSIAVDLAVDDAGAGAETAVPSSLLEVDDAGSGAEDGGNVATVVPVTDTASGAEGDLGLLAEIPLSDSGAGSELPEILANLAALTDSGSGADEVSLVSAIFTIQDLGSGDDALTFQANITVTDAGEALETVLGIVAQILLLESASGVDAPTVQAALTVVDSGTGAETSLSLIAGFVLLDAGSGSEGTPQIVAQITMPDTGAGDDAQTIAVRFGITDVGSADDSLAVIARIGLVTDAGSGDESVTWKRTLAVADVGQAIEEAIAIIAQAAISDSGAGVDAGEVVARILLTDAGSEVTSLYVAANVALADAGTGQDAIDMLARVSLVDAGAGADQLYSITNFTVIADDGAGADDHSLLVRVPLTDSAVATDGISIRVTLPTLQDIGVGADTVGIVARLSLTDSGTGEEVHGLTIAIRLLDSVTGAESIAEVLARVSLEDVGAGDDVAGRLVPITLAEDGVGTDVLSAIQAWLALVDSGAGADGVTTSLWTPSVGITLLKYPAKDAPIDYEGKDPDVEYDLEA